MLKWMISEDYGDVRSISRRIEEMQARVANPELMEAGKYAEYAAIIDIDLNGIKEPILACSNDPVDVKLLSDVAGQKIDEVFIGSCVTNISHFRAAGNLLDNGKRQLPTHLWVSPPLKWMQVSYLMKVIIVSLDVLVLVQKCLVVLYVWKIKQELVIIRR